MYFIELYSFICVFLCAYVLQNSVGNALDFVLGHDSGKDIQHSKYYLNGHQVLIVGLGNGLSIFMGNISFNANGESCQIVAFARKGPIFIANARSIIATKNLSLEKSVDTYKNSLRNARTVVIEPISAFALDDIGQKLYWITSNDISDNESGFLRVSNFEGHYKKTIFHKPGYSFLNTLAVDSHNCYIFFFTSFRGIQLGRTTLDGNNHEVLHSFPDSVNVGKFTIRSIALDTVGQVVYWMEEKNKRNSIYSISYSGQNLKLVLSLPDAPHEPVNSLFFSNNELFWASKVNRNIYSCALKPAMHLNQCRIIVSALPDIRDFALVDKREFNDWPKDYWDVCESKSPCSHLCFRMASQKSEKPEFSCDCPSGFLMKEDKRTCYNYFHKFLVIGFGQPENHISVMSVDTTEFEPKVQQRVSEKWTIEQLSYDPQNRDFYWLEYDPITDVKRIMRSNSNLLVQFTLKDKMPVDLSVDWINRNLYWVTPTNIIVARLDGSFQTTILSFKNLKSVEVDPVNGFLYWAGNSHLYRANLDGSDKTMLSIGNHQTTGNKSEHCCMLSLNPDTGDLFYAGHVSIRKGLGVIRRGSNTFEDFTYHQSNMRQFNAIAAVGDTLYWFSVYGNQRFGSIQTDGTRFKLLKSFLGNALTAVGCRHQLHNEVTEPNPCLINNGGCSHICFYLPNLPKRYKCDCANHYQLQGKSCVVLDSFLIFSLHNIIGRLPLSGGVFDPIHISHVSMHVGCINAHMVKEQIYWIDFIDKKIWSAKLDGSDARVVLSGLYQPEGLAVDWVGQQLFFLDTKPWPRIEMISLSNTTLRKVILENSRHLNNPIKLVFNVANNAVCWINKAYIGHGSIVCLRHLETLQPDIMSMVTNLNDPISITLDPSFGQLYYIDQPRTLGGVSRDGNIKYDITLDEPNRPFSLTYFGAALYFSDSDSRGIKKLMVPAVLGKFPSSNATSLVKDLGSTAVGLVVLDKNTGFTNDNKCHAHSCQHFCFADQRVNNPNSKVSCTCANFYTPKTSEYAKRRDKTYQSTGCEEPAEYIHAVASDGSVLRSLPFQKSEDLVGKTLFTVEYHNHKNLLKGTLKIQYAYDERVRTMVFFYLIANKAKENGIVACYYEPTDFCKLIIEGSFSDFVFDVLEEKFFVIDKKDKSIEYYQYGKNNCRDTMFFHCKPLEGPFTVVNCTEEACHPSSLAINPAESKLFWLDSGSKIVQSLVDGTNKEILISNKNYTQDASLLYYFSQDNFYNPDMPVHPPPGIYWIKKHKDGTVAYFREIKPNRTIVQTLVAFSLTPDICSRSCQNMLKDLVKLDSPLSISVSKDNLYILDRKSTIKSYSRLVPSPGFYWAPNFKDRGLRLTSMTVVPHNVLVSLKTPAPNKPIQSHTCSHLCIREFIHSGNDNQRPSLSKRCTCPAYMQLVPGKMQCELSPPCKENEFQCGSRRQCVPASSVCDKHKDCDDGSDQFCCDKDSFACRSKAQTTCVGHFQICDGIHHCNDKSDETEAACKIKMERTKNFHQQDIRPQDDSLLGSSLYTTYWLYILLGIIVLFCVALVGYCCSKEKPPMTLSVDPSIKLVKVDIPMEPVLDETQFFSLPSSHHRRSKRKSKSRRRLHSSPAVSDYENAEAKRLFSAAPPPSSDRTYSECRFSEAPHSYMETLNPPPSPCTDCSSLPGAKAAAARFMDTDSERDYERRSAPKRRRRKRSNGSGQRRKARGDPLVPPPSPSSSVCIRPPSFFQQVPPPTPQRMSLISACGGLETDI